MAVISAPQSALRLVSVPLATLNTSPLASEAAASRKARATSST
jgi:hypothetical protein